MINPPLRVLLVDDDEEDRELVRQTLIQVIKHIAINEMASGQQLID